MEVKTLLLSVVALLSIAGTTQLLKAKKVEPVKTVQTVQHNHNDHYGDCKQETKEGKNCTCSPHINGTCTKATDAAGFYCQC